MRRVLVLGAFHPAALEILSSEPELSVTQAEVLEDALLKEAEGLILRSTTRVTAAVLEKAPLLKVIGRAGAGVDNVDLDAARKRGVRVLHAAEAVTESTADLAMALMLAVARRIPQAHEALRAGRWEKGVLGVRLSGKTLGLLGYGRVGRAVGQRALAFGMRVVFHDPLVPGSLSFERLLGEADVLSLHLPLTDQTRHRMGREAFARMKPGALLIQCSRGGIVDEAALAEALASGRLAGAGLDVFETEPLPAGHPFLRLPNLVLTPHVGAATHESQADAARLIAHRVAGYLLKGVAEGAADLLGSPAP